MTTKFNFMPDKQPPGAFIAGVPLGDLDEETYGNLPAHLQKAVKAAPYYTEVTVVENSPKTAVTTKVISEKGGKTAVADKEGGK